MQITKYFLAMHDKVSCVAFCVAVPLRSPSSADGLKYMQIEPAKE